MKRINNRTLDKQQLLTKWYNGIPKKPTSIIYLDYNIRYVFNSSTLKGKKYYVRVDPKRNKKNNPISKLRRYKVYPSDLSYNTSAKSHRTRNSIGVFLIIISLIYGYSILTKSGKTNNYLKIIYSANLLEKIDRKPDRINRLTSNFLVNKHISELTKTSLSNMLRISSDVGGAYERGIFKCEDITPNICLIYFFYLSNSAVEADIDSFTIELLRNHLNKNYYQLSSEILDRVRDYYPQITANEIYLLKIKSAVKRNDPVYFNRVVNTGYSLTDRTVIDNKDACIFDDPNIVHNLTSESIRYLVTLSFFNKECLFFKKILETELAIREERALPEVDTYLQLPHNHPQSLFYRTMLWDSKNYTHYRKVLLNTKDSNNKYLSDYTYIEYNAFILLHRLFLLYRNDLLEFEQMLEKFKLATQNADITLFRYIEDWKSCDECAGMYDVTDIRIKKKNNSYIIQVFDFFKGIYAKDESKLPVEFWLDLLSYNEAAVLSYVATDRTIDLETISKFLRFQSKSKNQVESKINDKVVNFFTNSVKMNPHLRTNAINKIPNWQLKWWISLKLNTFPLATNYSTSENGLFQLPCMQNIRAIVSFDNNKGCIKLRNNDLLEQVSLQKNHLGSVASQYVNINPPDEAIKLWSSFYLGKKYVDDVLAAISDKLPNRMDNQYLYNYWYIGIEDSRLVKNLLSFHSEAESNEDNSIIY